MSSEVPANEEGGVELTDHTHLAPTGGVGGGGGQEVARARESPHLR